MSSTKIGIIVIHYLDGELGDGINGRQGQFRINVRHYWGGIQRGMLDGGFASRVRAFDVSSPD